MTNSEKENKNIEEILESAFFLKAKSSARFMDMLPAAIYIYNFKEKELYVNSYFRKISSLKSYNSLDDFALKKAIAHPDDWPMIKQCYNDSMQYHTDFLCEYRVVNDNGTISWVRDHAEYVFDSQGQTVLCQGVLTNINDHVYARQIIEQRQQIENSLSKFAKIFLKKEQVDTALSDAMKEVAKIANASRIMIVERNANGYFTCTKEWCHDDGFSIKESYRKMSGLSFPILKKALSSKDLLLFSDISQIPTEGDDLRLELEKEHVGAVMYAPMFAGSEICGYIRVDSEVSRTWDIPIQQLVLIVSMMIEQSKINDTINQLEQEKLAVLDSVSESVLLLDDKSRIVWGNDKSYALLGVDPAEANGKESDVLWNRVVDNQFRNRIKECISSGKVIQFERELANGKWFAVSLSPVKNEQNKFTRVVETSRDITNIREYENQLIEAKEKAEESNRLKSAFILNLSHEVRTPMNAILGFTQLLAYHNITPEKKKQFYELVETNTNQLSNIISDIIDLAKLETNQIKVSQEKFDVSALLKSVVETAQRKINVKQGSRIAFYHSNFSEEIEIISDSIWLQKVLDKLLDNAIKFTEEGSIDFGFYLNKNEGLVFYITDTGIGIESNMFEAIFEPYRQVDGSETRQFGGNGLGLTISQRVIKLLGGNIWLESVPGKGTTFYCSIPHSMIVGADDQDVDERDTSTPDLEGKKILIVDDIEDVYFYLSALLEFTGAECLQAMSGFQAIDVCKANPDIDLILMDVMMPEMDGIETVKHIRGFKPDALIFAQTAYAMSKQYEDSVFENFNEVLNKPIRPDDLYTLINKYF